MAKKNSYLVQGGESYESISMKLFGTNKYAALISRMNKNARLYKGMRLNIQFGQMVGRRLGGAAFRARQAQQAGGGYGYNAQGVYVGTNEQMGGTYDVPGATGYTSTGHPTTATGEIYAPPTGGHPGGYGAVGGTETTEPTTTPQRGEKGYKPGATGFVATPPAERPPSERETATITGGFYTAPRISEFETGKVADYPVPETDISKPTSRYEAITGKKYETPKWIEKIADALTVDTTTSETYSGERAKSIAASQEEMKQIFAPSATTETPSSVAPQTPSGVNTVTVQNTKTQIDTALEAQDRSLLPQVISSSVASELLEIYGYDTVQAMMEDMDYEEVEPGVWIKVPEVNTGTGVTGISGYWQPLWNGTEYSRVRGRRKYGQYKYSNQSTYTGGYYGGGASNPLFVNWGIGWG